MPSDGKTQAKEAVATLKRMGTKRTRDGMARYAADERNFVKKGVSWALRAIGRRNLELHAAAVAVAKRLAASPQAAAQWVGKDALRELTSPSVTRRLAARREPRGAAHRAS